MSEAAPLPISNSSTQTDIGPRPDLKSEPIPTLICGYPVEAKLESTQSAEDDFLGPGYRATGPADHSVVFKPLDPDCLVKNKLHPNIKERLSRIRELALGGVANLHGVERDPALPAVAAWLIWEHIPGQTLTEYASDPGCTTRKLAMAAREMVLAVEALHRQGIVHGALRGSNVIVNASGSIRLTHLSPLLYSDPADDVWGIMTTLQEMVAAKKDADSSLSRAVAEVRAWIDEYPEPGPPAELVLRTLTSRLGGVIDARDRVETATPTFDDARIPARRSILAAVLVAVFATAAAVGIWLYLSQIVGENRNSGVSP